MNANENTPPRKCKRYDGSNVLDQPAPYRVRFSQFLCLFVCLLQSLAVFGKIFQLPFPVGTTGNPVKG